MITAPSRSLAPKNSFVPARRRPSSRARRRGSPPADYIPPIVGAALLALCALPPLIRPGEIWSFVPLLLAATGVVNAILGFFGDVWERSEMERHAFIGSMVLRLGLILCLLRLIEEARRRWAPERPSAP